MDFSELFKQTGQLCSISYNGMYLVSSAYISQKFFGLGLVPEQSWAQFTFTRVLANACN